MSTTEKRRPPISARAKGAYDSLKDQTYIVDRIFEHANLVLGSGKKAQKVEISRGHNQ